MYKGFDPSIRLFKGKGNRANKIVTNIFVTFCIHIHILLGFLFLFSTISPKPQLQQNMTGSTLYYCVVVFFYLGIYIPLINVKDCKLFFYDVL